MAEGKVSYLIVRDFVTIRKWIISMSLCWKKIFQKPTEENRRKYWKKGYKEINRSIIRVQLEGQYLKIHLLQVAYDSRLVGCRECWGPGMTFGWGEQSGAACGRWFIGVSWEHRWDSSDKRFGKLKQKEKKRFILLFSLFQIVYLVIYNTTNEINRKMYEEGYSTRRKWGLRLKYWQKNRSKYGTVFLETELQEEIVFTSFEDWRYELKNGIFIRRVSSLNKYRNLEKHLLEIAGN